MLGMPVVGFATSEQAVVLQDGVTGFASTDLEALIDGMRALVDDRGLAIRMGTAARERASALFDLDRFVGEWEATFREVAGLPTRVLAGSVS